jgi:excisionase family DNA binding protein
MNQAGDDPILDVDGVSKYLQLSRSKVYGMLTSGELPGHKIGKQWRLRRSAVAAWLDAQLAPAAAGLVARSLDAPAASSVSGESARSVGAPALDAATRSPGQMTPRLTADQYGLLRGIWIGRPEQFIAIAATPDGKKSLARLLGIAPETVDAIARSFESAPHNWVPDQASGS